MLLKLEQEGAIASEWGASENNRPGPFLSPGAVGTKGARNRTRDRAQAAAAIARFLAVKAEDWT